MSLLPVIIYDEGVELPDEGTYFVVAGNGIFLRKEFDLVSAFIPVDKIGVLPDLEAPVRVKSKTPKVPASVIAKIKEFFRRVVVEFEAEACTVLFYNKDADDWKVHVSLQSVSHGGVRYQRGREHVHSAEFDGYSRVGTIHSHCDFNSFHSGTDIGDELDFDGIHGTFGHNHKEKFSITSSIVVNGQRMEVDPLELFEGIDHNEGASDRYVITTAPEHREFYEQGVEEWMEKVRRWGYERDDVIRVGDGVIWAGDNSLMKADYGEGPFEVTGEDGDHLLLAGPSGEGVSPNVLRLPKLLFKKVIA